MKFARSGLVIALALAYVACQSPGVTGVGSATVASITLTTSAVTILPNQTLTVTAVPHDAAGNALSGRTVSWTSSNPGVATVDNNGLVTAVVDGLVTLTAMIDGKSASVTISVASPAPPDSVAALGGWTPVYDRPLASKYEGVSFADSLNGWVISDRGELLHTANGGVTWSVQTTLAGHLRSLDFVNASLGFVGTLGGVLYRTTDGGVTWTNINSSLPKTPLGFCGISHLGNAIYVVGRYQGAADFYSSTDGGISWQYHDLSALAQGLVEVVFVDSMTGFIGGMAKSATAGNGAATILKTTDGGQTWRTVFAHDVTPGWAWKIFPVTVTRLYGSLESHDGTLRVVRSNDAGETWNVQVVATGRPTELPVQGIGFLDANVGWIGGWFAGMYATTNGGATWSSVGGTSANINRIRKVGSTLFTAGTKGVLRYDPKH